MVVIEFSVSDVNNVLFVAGDDYTIFLSQVMIIEFVVEGYDCHIIRFR
jgi:hypothetical protein